VGNLMVLLQIGSMPHELALENIELFGREVLPGLRDVWEDQGWVNHWWPERLRQRVPALPAGIAAGGAWAGASRGPSQPARRSVPSPSGKDACGCAWSPRGAAPR